MWKYQDFTVTYILREINFGESRSSENAILAILAAVNFEFLEIFDIFNSKILLKLEFKASEMTKMTVLTF